MHRDRNNGNWPELKAKRHNNKFDDAPLKSLEVMHDHLDGVTQDSHKVKKDKAAKQLADEQDMFKDMADYADKQEKHE